MRPDPGKPYYTAYDKRYRAVYGQGVDCWTAHPAELSTVRAEVTEFLDAHRIAPDAHIVEFGCGEGFVGELLAGLGYPYTGIDIAEAAVAKARKRLARFGQKARVLVDDLLALSAIPDASFDAGMDVACLHMLVLDAGREAYLRNAFRLLRPGAPMLFCNEAWRADAPAERVATYDDWLRLSRTDVDIPEEREAWQDGQFVRIRLPRIVSRARTVAQYRREVTEAGFAFVQHRIVEKRTISFSVTKRHQESPRISA